MICENEEGCEHYSDKVFCDYGETDIIREKPDGWQRYSDDTLKEFKEGYRLCKIAAAYVQRIDWLVSGDDGEDTFHERLKDDMGEIESEIKRLDEIKWNEGKKREDVEE